MRFGKFIIIGAIIGLTAVDYLHVTDKIKEEQDAPVVHATPKPAPVTANTLSPAPIAGLNKIKIGLYHIQFTEAEPDDLVYGEVQYGGKAVAGFTTESLLARYPDCKAGVLGVLTRTPAPTPPPSPSPSPVSSFAPMRASSSLPFRKWINGYQYSFTRSYYSCADDSAGQNAVAQARAALINSLPSLAQ